MSIWRGLIAAFAALLAANAANAQEAKELRVGRQVGLGYLQLYLMEELKLVEKHAAAAGLGEVAVSYRPIGSPTTLNDGLLSGNLDMAAAGPTTFLVLWDRTQRGAKAVSALNMQPLYLNTNKAAIKSLKDFGDKDRIAVPAIKVSTQSIFLQIAAEQMFGPGKHNAFEAITVGLPHPEAHAAVMSGKTEITAHFATAPLQYQQLQNPDIHKVISSYDIMGGPVMTTNVWAMAKFRDANPRLYQAFFAALQEATEFINKNQAEAARIYIKVDKSSMEPAFVEKMLRDPEIIFSLQPYNAMKFADFLHRIGTLKNRPTDWKDLFFPEVHGLPGS